MLTVRRVSWVMVVAMLAASCSSGGGGDDAADAERSGRSERGDVDLAAPAPAEVPEGGIPIDVIAPGDAGAVPVTVGVPVPAADADQAWRIASEAGPVATQVREQVRLGDGLAWLLVDFQARPGTQYWLEAGEPPEPDSPVSVSEGSAVIDTGVAEWVVPDTTDLLASAGDAVTGAGFGETAPAEVRVTEEGPLRTQVRVAAEEAVEGLDLVAHLDFYAGLPYARVRITLTNHSLCIIEGEAPPEADNGPNENGTEENQPSCNGLLSANRVAFDDITWGIDVADPSGGDEVLYQDSSGTDFWDRYRDDEPRMQSGVEFRGFERRDGGEAVESGDVADGTMTSGSVRIDVPWFRELFPKALRRSGSRLEVGLFPDEFSAQHVVRAGEQKTHDLYVSLDPEIGAPFPVYAAPDASWLDATEALGPLPTVGSVDGEAAAAYDEYLAAQLDPSTYVQDECNNNLDECGRSLGDARERFDYYGWTDFGDIPSDFEDPRSPYNLKYDANLGFLLQAIRGESVEWWEWAQASNIHYADIDILHHRVRGVEAERAWWWGGTFGHSYHDETGIHNPHRNYANPNPDTYWGGAGMSAYALITGDPVVREGAVELADNTLWRMRNSADTDCMVSAYGGGIGEGYAVFEPDGRAVANATRILVFAWRLTGDDTYLDAAGAAGDWVGCEAEALSPCASWKEGLAARAVAEYVVSAQQAGVEVAEAAPTAVLTLADALRERLTVDGDRAWLVDCEDFEEINAWELMIADVFTYAARFSGDDSWADTADALFNVGATDPYYEGDTVQYHTSKEMVNVVDDGLVYLGAQTAD